MVFTVELRYGTGSSTILSTEADTADQALNQVRDPRRELISIRVSAPAMEEAQRAPAHTEERQQAGYRRVPAHHRRSRRS